VIKARHLANPDPEVARGRDERAAVEARLLKDSALIFSAGSCRLCQIDTARLASEPLSP